MEDTAAQASAASGGRSLRAALDVWLQPVPDYTIPDGFELTYSFNPRAPHSLPLTW